MKLSRIKFENYRRLMDSEIEVRDNLVVVGANDVGKSSLLRALDLVLGARTAQLFRGTRSMISGVDEVMLVVGGHSTILDQRRIALIADHYALPYLGAPPSAAAR
ncbi:ATP-binding protein [Arthrobacter sp. CJ23]|uniref:ATP-binding protein n=1 Tax=Arthrobacter sp. CJ23 TaxID=2972479 RepID=UPI00215C0DBC|nr:ATP-binding protein [Arthrobacter sp. CJ23]UVJ41250.1 ATP-binding protein [Arthrobacter sp. CJ23]